MSVHAPSPLAHGPLDLCDSCRDCPSCRGGAAPVPAQYRVLIHDDGRCEAVCTGCGGSGTSCLNLLPERRPAP